MTAVNSGTPMPSAGGTARRMWISVLLVLALAAVSLVAAAESAEASHFRYRDISWQRLSGNEVELTMKMADRRSFYSNVQLGDPWDESVSIGEEGNKTFHGEVIAVNETDDWFIAELTATHTYETEGPHTIEWSDCCTLSSLKNSAGVSLASRAVVDLREGNNSSPKTQVLPIMPIPADGEQTFRVPALDRDGDITEFRLATTAEMGGSATQPPALSIDENGTGTWDTSGLDEGLYMATVVAFDDRGAESQITWLLDLGGEPVGDLPAWTEPTPAERSTFVVREGDSTSFTLSAEDPDEEDTVTISSLGLPEGVDCDDSGNVANPAQLDCTFEPVDSGFELLTFIAQDQNGNAEAVRSYVVGSGRYVALGDGLSSGEGLGDYDPDTDDEGVNECRRSADAFPHLLAEDSSVPGWFDPVACSGTALVDLDGEQWDEDPQVDALNNDVTLVTLTLGDELGLPGFLEECAAEDDDCADTYGDDVEEALADLDAELSDELMDLKNRSPRARVLVVSQPRLFPHEPAAECDGLSAADQGWANDQVQALNELLASHARGFAEFVDAQGVAEGHEQCSGEPWVENFRPDADGHRALADAILDQVGNPPGITVNVLPDEHHDLPSVTVEPGQDEATFSTQWPGSDVIMTLTPPSGDPITRGEVPEDAVHDRGPTYEVFRIPDPEEGEWGVSLYGADVAPGGEETRFLYQDLPTEIVDEATAPPSRPRDRTVVVETGSEVSVDSLLQITVRSPRGGSPEVEVRDTQSSEPDGFALLPVEGVVAARTASVWNPLMLTFRLHTSALPEGRSADDLVLFRDGDPVPACEADHADPDPCVAGVRVDDDVITLVARSTSASVWSLGVEPVVSPAPSPVCQETEEAPFTDLVDNVHAGAIGCLVRLEVARGVTEAQYRPADDVTRGQMATFVVSALRAAGVSLPVGSDAFTDDDGTTHEDAINVLTAAGIVRGVTDDAFRPSAPVTRAQVATFLVAAHRYATDDGLTGSVDAFTDDNGNIHEDAINAAAEAGLVRGVGEATFAPDVATPRDQMASFVSRLLQQLVTDLM